MFKCRDAAGKITYSSEDCGKIGLSPAGGVKDRVIVQETRKPQPLPPMLPDLAHPPEPEAAGNKKQKCFLIQTPFGTARRCVDTTEANQQID